MERNLFWSAPARRLFGVRRLDGALVSGGSTPPLLAIDRALEQELIIYEAATGRSRPKGPSAALQKRPAAALRKALNQKTSMGFELARFRTPQRRVEIIHKWPRLRAKSALHNSLPARPA